jgi:hypothetical protein
MALAALALPATALGAGVQAASETARGDGSIGVAAQTALSEGPLPVGQAAYDRAKKRAAAQAAAPSGAFSADLLAPVTIRGWDGLVDPNSAPSDSTSAVGTTRYIELVNRKFAIYNKTTNTPISQGTLGTLGASPGNVFDPQIIWDPQTNRFYYVMDDVRSASSNLLSFGYSKSSSPNNGTTDWCHYNLNYGANFPDYPKLGDTTHFLLMGSNVFGPSSFLRSDVSWVTKPAAGTTCQAASAFGAGTKQNIRDPLGGPAFTPVPANQTDTSSTGYVVTRTGSLPSTRLSLHRVTRNTDGSANIQSPGQSVVVPSYNSPPDAPQRSGFPNSAKQLDTLDARPTQAVSALDPAHVSGSAPGLWTQHTTATSPASTRSEVRWYEINPVTRTLFQSGKVTTTAYSVFNGAISPDRRRTTSTGAFGQNMVLGFTTSGPSTFPAIRQVSKLGTAAQSARVTVRSSTGNYSGFDCAGSDNSCRWGDYAGATPDPSTYSGATRGRVWSVNQYASGVQSTTAANWKTWNWAATP